MDVNKRPRKRTKTVEATVAIPANAQFRPPRPQPSFARQIGAVAAPSAPERKNIDVTTTITGGAAGIWSAVTLLNQIAQGATANQRIGRRVVLKSLLLRYNLAPSSTNNYGRVLVVYDHAPNGALPVITDILTVDQINGPNNLINNDRFMVLHDEYLCNPASINARICGKWYLKLGPGGVGLQNQWTNATTGTIADITTGAIYIMTCDPSSTNSLAFTARIRFTDM